MRSQDGVWHAVLISETGSAQAPDASRLARVRHRCSRAASRSAGARLSAIRSRVTVSGMPPSDAHVTRTEHRW